MKIVLDPGHYTGYNPGIIPGFYEGNNNFNACVYWKEYIESHYENVSVTLTKKTMAANPDLIQRGAMGRDADLFYSWHSNGVDNKNAYGVSTFSSVRRDGKKLCEAIAASVVETFKACGSKDTYNRGYTKRQWSDKLPDVDWYGVLRSATLKNPNEATSGQKPIDSECKQAIIIEHGFHSNVAECSVLADPDYLKKIVENEIKAIAKYYNLKEKAPSDMYYFAVLSANKNKKYAEEDVARAKKLGFSDAYVKYAKRDGAL